MKRARAFTLIELLVSVSIISALISILLPAMGAARRQGLRTSCQARLRQVQQAIWAYSASNDNRVPYVVSPMTNGTSTIPGYGRAGVTDASINPYDPSKWPLSLQNLLLPLYLANAKQVFVCPAARLGWPRSGKSWELTYRDAAVNQPGGTVSLEDSYQRESFGFMDGRPMNELRVHFTGDPIRDAQIVGSSRGTYLRDLVWREGDHVLGPHDGGINVINRDFGVEFRKQDMMEDDLAASGGGVRF